MRLSIVLCVPVLAALAACQESRPPCSYNPFLVPATALVAGQTHSKPDQVLPASDALYYFPRAERVVYGSTSYGDSSTYTTSTFDSQAIGIPGTGGYGYRYRWIIQEGVSSP